MSDEPKLLPCPFCGGEGIRIASVEVEDDNTITNTYRVECGGCGVERYGDDDAEAVAAWNLRSPPVAGEAETVTLHHHPDNAPSPALDSLVSAAAAQFINPFGALRFEAVPAVDEHAPSHVLAVTSPEGGGPLIPINHDADYRVCDRQAQWMADACNAALRASPTVPATPEGFAAGDHTPAAGWFGENVDAWKAPEWFDRLARAVRQHDKARVAGNDIEADTCAMIISSSAFRLVRDFEPDVRSALIPTSAATGRGEAVAWLGYWSGAGSVDSHTAVTRHKRDADDWQSEGAEITPLFAHPAPAVPDIAPSGTGETVTKDHAAALLKAAAFLRDHARKLSHEGKAWPGDNNYDDGAAALEAIAARALPSAPIPQGER